MDWSGRRTTGSYPDSKLFVTTLAIAVARIWTDVSATRSTRHEDGRPQRARRSTARPLAQEWLATSDDPQARTSGGYGHHQIRADPAPSVHDREFQDQLLEALTRFIATRLV